MFSRRPRETSLPRAVHEPFTSRAGSVKVPERVTCVCYSNAPEGISVNCVAAGLASGAVRLYSSWDLRKVAYIPPLDRCVPLLRYVPREARPAPLAAPPA